MQNSKSDVLKPLVIFILLYYYINKLGNSVISIIIDTEITVDNIFACIQKLQACNDCLFDQVFANLFVC